MNAIRTTPPNTDEQPSWAEHWAAVAYEWELAAREVCQLADPTQVAAAGYLRWEPGQASAGETPWWHSELDWDRFPPTWLRDVPPSRQLRRPWPEWQSG